MSVAGGSKKAGMVLASVASCGPGVVSALGTVTLTAPSGGRSGLPSEAAAATPAATTAPPAAVEARMLRRDNGFIVPPEGSVDG